MNDEVTNRRLLKVVRAFANLNVRPKLMVLHNLFFLVLACAAYFSLIPLFEKLVSDAHKHEVMLVERSGGARATMLKEVKAAQKSYTYAVIRAKVTLFLVLGSIYVLAVLILESAIMPLFVYLPLKRMLQADLATQTGDRDRELIPSGDIPGDEFGQIMRSRNDTVAALRQQEEEVASALRRLEEQDRLVSLGLLSASVAHEMNTPLSVLNGSIEKLIETTRDPATLDRLARMQRVAQRLQKISESLVGFAKPRTEEMERVAVRPLIDESWSLVAIDEKSSAVEFVNLVSPEDRVVGNPDRLIQVFVNLLRNALNAVDLSGRIEAKSRRFERSGELWVAIDVDDNGPGISIEVLPEIFDAFVTTRLDSRGTGLGLTVAEGIVAQHGGTIHASNRHEGGARLEVILPGVRSGNN